MSSKKRGMKIVITEHSEIDWRVEVDGEHLATVKSRGEAQHIKDFLFDRSKQHGQTYTVWVAQRPDGKWNLETIAGRSSTALTRCVQKKPQPPGQTVAKSWELLERQGYQLVPVIVSEKTDR